MRKRIVSLLLSLALCLTLLPTAAFAEKAQPDICFCPATWQEPVTAQTCLFLPRQEVIPSAGSESPAGVSVLLRQIR